MKKRTKKKVSKRKNVEKELKRGSNWSMNDFVDSVWKTMQEQAEKFPAIREVHAKLEPEWNMVIQKIALLLESKKAEEIEKYIEEICKFGSKAVRPLIDALLKFKSLVNDQEKK